MAKLSEPSMELAERLLSEVGFEKRFVGVKMMPRAGNRVSSIYSFEEAVDFLHPDSLEDLLSVGSRSCVGYLDLDQLRRWVGEGFGDKELAEEMGKEIEKSNSYMDKVKIIKQLMQQRLSQCNKILRDKMRSLF